MVHIVVSQECKSKLDSLKVHIRDTYGDVVDKLVSEHEELISVDSILLGPTKITKSFAEHIGVDQPLNSLEDPSFSEAIAESNKIHKVLNPEDAKKKEKGSQD